MRAARPVAFTSAVSVAEDVVGGLRVEIAGRLVGEQDARAVGDGAGDRDALLLAARKLGRAMALARPKAEIAQELAAAVRRLRAREAGDHLRQDEVLERREFRQEVMELIDEADLVAPQRRCAPRRSWSRSPRRRS